MAVRIRSGEGFRNEPERATYTPYLSVGDDFGEPEQASEFTVESPPEPHLGGAMLGPGPLRAEPLRARAFEVHPGPNEPAFSAGWREVTIPLAVEGAPDEISALVYYPSLRGGQDAAIAERDGSLFKLIALAHGWWPEQEDHYRTDQEIRDLEVPDAWPLSPECSGNLIRKESLFRRFRGTQQRLATYGFASIAVDLLWRWDFFEDVAASEAIRSGIDWVLREWPLGAALDRDSIGLVGHSHGAQNMAHLVYDMREKRNRGEWSSGWDVPAVAFLGPMLLWPVDTQEYDASLWVGGWQADMYYPKALSRKYLVRLSPEAHWAYFDGMCLGEDAAVSRVDASIQRQNTQTLLSGFFRRELLAKSMPNDLGLTSWDGIEAFCYDLGRGDICARGEISR
jgi:hypothetical protein